MTNLLLLLLKKFRFAVFTPDNHLTPVMRYGLFDRLVLPGHSPLNPFIERPLTPFRTSIRVVLLEFDEILSTDGIPFSIRLTILYQFNPQAAPRNIMVQFATAPENMLDNIVKDYASRGLRRLVGRYQAADLCQEAHINQIEQTLGRSLRAELSPLGFTFAASGAVLLREIVPPERYKRTMLDANLHAVTLAALADSQHLELIRQALQAELINSLEHVDGNVIVTPSVEAAVLGGMMGGTKGDGRSSRPVA